MELVNEGERRRATGGLWREDMQVFDLTESEDRT